MADTAVSEAALRRRVVWASTVGNALEWFDFTIFGLFSGVIGKLFFPSTDPTAALLSTYGLLAIGFVTRPLGGIFFGIWADRVGRKRALITVVLLMALGTTMIGLMPTYASIGIAAPIGLLLARLIQGFSAGGEFGSSTAMLLEFAPPERRGFYASFQFVAQSIAFVMGPVFAFVLNSALPPEAMASWGWRIPFLAGLVIAPVGFFLRRAIDETPEFKAFLAKGSTVPQTPFRTVLARYPLQVLGGLMVIAGPTANLYVGTVFMPNFAANALHLKLVDAQLGLTVVALAQCVLIPAVAILSDRYGRSTLMWPGAILYLLVAGYLIAGLLAEPSNGRLWALQGATLFLTLFSATLPALMTEILPVNVRSTGASISYNLAVALFGGMAPYTTAKLVDLTHSQFAPFYYVGACVLIALFGLALLSSKPREQPALA